MTGEKTKNIDFGSYKEHELSALRDCFEAGDSTMNLMKEMKEKYPDLVKEIEKHDKHEIDPEQEGLAAFKMCINTHSKTSER